MFFFSSLATNEVYDTVINWWAYSGHSMLVIVHLRCCLCCWKGQSSGRAIGRPGLFSRQIWKPCDGGLQAIEPRCILSGRYNMIDMIGSLDIIGWLWFWNFVDHPDDCRWRQALSYPGWCYLEGGDPSDRCRYDSYLQYLIVRFKTIDLMW